MRSHRVAIIFSAVAASCVLLGFQAAAAGAYNPITPTDANQTFVLNGHNLTVDKLVAIARFGAKVNLSQGARQRSLNAYYLLLEGSREGIPIYFFNRGTGAGRQNVIFSGDPLSTDVTPTSPTCPQTGQPCSNRDFLLQRQLATFQNGARGGEGPEVNDEEIVRAMMAERVNTMSYEAATPQVTQMLIDLLNKDVTPVVQSRGSPGEGDLPQMGNVEATMVGAGQAYYQGNKMSALDALSLAGLKPLQDQAAQLEAPGAPFAADDAAVTSTNAFTMGQAALLLYDAQRMLNWQDLIYAMELDGMNSSLTPIAAPVQSNRPFPWINADAARVLDMLSVSARTGRSYLFDIDQTSPTGVPFRIIQDPESLRALSQRDGSAWEAWNQLMQDLLTQLNSSDHNPAVTPGWSPSSAPELSTPWFMQYYVTGGPDDSACVGGGVGPATGCQHGYILSNANWDPYPIDNEIEALTNALANIAVNDDMVPLRFENTFFTVIAANDPSLPAAQLTNSAPGAADYTLADLLAEIQTLQNPVPAQGNSIVSTVEDLQAEGRIKVAKARLIVDDLNWLLGQDLLTAARWIDIRQIQGNALSPPLARSFGSSPTAAWQAFRTVVPWQVPNPASRPSLPPGTLAYDFLLANPASMFYPPAAHPPRAGENVAISMRALRGAIRSARARTARFQNRRARAQHTYLVLQAQFAKKH
jgi:histidine ammonia-lyase